MAVVQMKAVHDAVLEFHRVWFYFMGALAVFWGLVFVGVWRLCR